MGPAPVGSGILLRDGGRGGCADRAGVHREAEAVPGDGSARDHPGRVALNRRQAAGRHRDWRPIDCRPTQADNWPGLGNAHEPTARAGKLRCQISSVRSLDDPESPSSDHSDRTVDAIANELPLVRSRTEVP